MNKKQKVELLVPAGNLEKLETAINYGADAIYLSGKNFSLRNFSHNFSLKKMYLARKITYKKKIKMYLAINTFSKNKETNQIKKYLKKIKNIKPNAIIISDPSIFILSQKLIPEIPIHISTQANITNYNSVMFWEKLGAKRINVARELNLREIKNITSKNNIEIETFIHGAMCMSYSGRCFISNFITMRESNQGMCCQACRFKYAVVEKKNSKEYYPIYEDKKSSYIFSSKDLCMINHIPKLIRAGITSFKIEGRMKSINYVANITKTYREAIDLFYKKHTHNYPLLLKKWFNNISSIKNRKYSTGFFFNKPKKNILNYYKNSNKNSTFIGKVLHHTKNGKTLVNIRNKILSGDKIKIISTLNFSYKFTQIDLIYNKNKKVCSHAQPGSNVYIVTNVKCKKSDIIQKIMN